MAPSSFRIHSLDHVQLAMPPGGEDIARAFYSGVLGLKETPKPANLARRGGVWFESGAVRIHLGVEQDFRPAKKAHPALLVRDLKALACRLQSANVTVITDEPLDGYDRFYAADPFGNRVEFLEPTGSSLHATIKAEDPAGEEVGELLHAMCAELKLRHGNDASPFSPEEALPPHGAFVVARANGIAAGCGALRRLEETVGEIKRMFVSPAYRGRGIARRLLAELERLAALRGYSAVRLETGDRQPEAIALYESAGFRRILPIGGCAEKPVSICYEKTLQ
jgi:GNAT superfamily N-acetyltransferase